MTTELDTTKLAALALKINGEHTECELSFRNALEHAHNVGTYLMEAKSLVAHGQWRDWITTNCPDVSERTAQRYMKIANEWDTIQANTTHVTDLSIRSALKLIEPTKWEPTPEMIEKANEINQITKEAHDKTLQTLIQTWDSISRLRSIDQKGQHYAESAQLYRDMIQWALSLDILTPEEVPGYQEIMSSKG